MNDRDHSLQDEFDRYFRGDGSAPDTTEDLDAAAYQTVFAALEEEPEGSLPDDFAHQVADRAGVGVERSLAWTDILLFVVAVSGLGATLVVMPSVATVLDETVWVLLRSLRSLSTSIRLDVVGAAGLVLALTLGLDSMLRHWRPLRRAPSAS